MKSSYLYISLFGLLMAAFAIILRFFEYKYYIGSFRADIYTSLIATIFTVIGVWIGATLLKRKGTILKNNTEINQVKLKELKLNEREYEILKLISKGLTNQEIANRLFLALPTIKTHTSNLYTKLAVQSRTQATHKAQSLNII